MKKSRKLISMPIVSIEEGLQIGSVRGLIVNSDKMEIAAIVLDKRGWFKEQKIIPYSKVKSIGMDALTIDQSSNVQKPINLPEILKLIKEKANPIGARVITESGTVLGLVDEYNINEETGKIVSLEISGKFLESLFKGKALLSAEHIRKIGVHAIVVKNGAETLLEKIDGGLQETFSNIKEGTSSILESTIQRTKELSKNIKDKYEKRDKSLNVNKPPSNGEALDFSTVESEISSQPAESEKNSNITSDIQISKEEILPEIIDFQPPPSETPCDTENPDKN